MSATDHSNEGDGPRISDLMELIAHFDILIEENATIDVILCRTAQFANCTVAYISPEHVIVKTFQPDGKRCNAAPGPSAVRRSLAVGGQVWVEPAGEVDPLDRVLIDRLAITATAAIRSLQSETGWGSDPASWNLQFARRLTRCSGHGPSASSVSIPDPNSVQWRCLGPLPAQSPSSANFERQPAEYARPAHHSIRCGSFSFPA
ncbi:hypothetical protein QV65_32220 [Rhodococcus erythropolis]|nr:hypothetical protein QV65_32220 [Rhodococcus erythropolis]